MAERLRFYNLEDAVVLEISGDHDLATVPVVEPQIDAILSDARPRVIYDLSECTYLDSTMLGLLLRGYKRLGDRMRIVAPVTAKARRLLDVVRFDAYIPIHESVDDAAVDHHWNAV